MPSLSNKERIIPIGSPSIDANRLFIIESVPRHIRSRRRRWLHRNPTYFDSASADLELEDPLTYDRLIRQHQSPAEREAEGRKKGWASTLETSLVRSEARLTTADPTNPKYQGAMPQVASTNSTGPLQRQGPRIDWTIDGDDREIEPEELSTQIESKQASMTQNGPNDSEADVKNKVSDHEKWHDLLAQRFIDGYDDNFDYKIVDDNELYDEEWEGQRSQDDWFEDEEEHLDGREGETGIQDF